MLKFLSENKFITSWLLFIIRRVMMIHFIRATATGPPQAKCATQRLADPMEALGTLPLYLLKLESHLISNLP